MTKDEAHRKGIELQKALGAAIKSAREGRELTHITLATRIYSDSGNISRLENGKQWAAPVMLVLLSRALSVPIWTLFAEAEGAIRGPELDLLEVYQQSDEQGQQLITHAVGLAKRYHLRPPSELTMRAVKKHGQPSAVEPVSRSKR